jgi:hypothetical protein
VKELGIKASTSLGNIEFTLAISITYSCLGCLTISFTIIYFFEALLVSFGNFYNWSKSFLYKIFYKSTYAFSGYVYEPEPTFYPHFISYGLDASSYIYFFTNTASKL